MSGILGRRETKRRVAASRCSEPRGTGSPCKRVPDYIYSKGTHGRQPNLGVPPFAYRPGYGPSRAIAQLAERATVTSQDVSSSPGDKTAICQSKKGRNIGTCLLVVCSSPRFAQDLEHGGGCKRVPDYIYSKGTNGRQPNLGVPPFAYRPCMRWAAAANSLCVAMPCAI